MSSQAPPLPIKFAFKLLFNLYLLSRSVISISPLLDGLIFLEFASIIAAPYACTILGELGARVIKVEDKTGVGLRTLGPFPPTALGDIEAGGLHLALDAGKESIVIDFEQSVEVDQFDRLASAVDIVLLSRSTKLDSTLLERHVALRDKNPELVLGVHSPFGVDGPYSDRSSSEIVLPVLL